MEEIEVLLERLGQIASYDDFFEVRRSLHKIVEGEPFRALWSIAIQHRGTATGMAGYMLAELQPFPARNLEALLVEIHASQLDASNRIVPFYLVAEFGKQAVTQACDDFLTQQADLSVRSRVDAVRYWALHPASELCNRFHDWEAREMYGVTDDA